MNKKFQKITGRFRERFESDSFLVGVEVDPPRGNSVDEITPELKKLVRAGVDFLGASDSPMARYRLSAVATAFLLKQKLSIETMIHITCRDRNLIGIHSELLGASSLGINMILALYGDNPSAGDLPDAKGVFDSDANKIVQVASSFNDGKDLNGNQIKGKTDFLIGVAFDPLSNFDSSVQKLRYRMELGARFAITQPVYSSEALEKVKEAESKTGMRILVGVMPILSYKNAQYLNDNVPGISVPDEISSKFKGLSKEDARETTIEIFSGFVKSLREQGFKGVYIMPPLEKYDIVYQILSRAL